jgi:hypothetical protein
VRVLLDANVLIRANEKSVGPARSLLLELISRKHVILTSADLLIELGRTLRYPRVQALYELSEEQIYDYVQFLKSACDVVPLPGSGIGRADQFPAIQWSIAQLGVRDEDEPDVLILMSTGGGDWGNPAEKTNGRWITGTRRIKWRGADGSEIAEASEFVAHSQSDTPTAVISVGGTVSSVRIVFQSPEIWTQALVLLPELREACRIALPI